MSDESRVAPGAETLRELFGGEPTLILLDELSVYLRKVPRLDDTRDQLTAFLTSLFKAVEGAPNAALVYTLAIGKDGRATEALRLPTIASYPFPGFHSPKARQTAFSCCSIFWIALRAPSMGRVIAHPRGISYTKTILRETGLCSPTRRTQRSEISGTN